MGNAVEVRHYFMEAYTPYGIISLLPELLEKVKHTYLFTGELGTGKSTMIKLTGIQLIDRGYDVDYIRSIREPDSVAGLYLPKQKIVLLDEKEFLPQDYYPVGYYREINFSDYCRKGRIEQAWDSIRELEKTLKAMEQKISGQLREEYPPEDKDEINSLFSLKKLFWYNEKSKENQSSTQITEILSKIKKSLLSFYFLQGLQLDGWLNLAPRFIKDYDRICVEGEDSAEILVDILEEVKYLGQVMEIVVHPLKPSTILGIVLPEKHLAVWKGNPCHIQEQGFIKKHTGAMMDVLEKYKTTRLQLKCLINETVNFHGLDELRSELISSILTDVSKGAP